MIKIHKPSNPFKGIDLRTGAVGAELLLLVVSLLMLILGIIFTPMWAYQMKIGDLYTYMGLLILTCLWSVGAILFSIKRSLKGVRIFTIILAVLTGCQLVVGFIHAMLLYMYYRPAMMSSCLQRQPARLFLWSLGYENVPEMVQLHKECDSQWTKFAAWRMITWGIMTFFTVLTLLAVQGYYRHLKPHLALRSSEDESMDPNYEKQTANIGRSNSMRKDRYTDDDNQGLLEKNHDEEQAHNEPPAYPQDANSLAIARDMYKQRQKLYAEIAKRRHAKDSSNRRSRAMNSQRHMSNGSVHPLDFHNPGENEALNSSAMNDIDHDDMDGGRDNLSYPDNTRYEDSTNQPYAAIGSHTGDHRDSFSAEKIEYDNYRANHPYGSGNDKAANVLGMTSSSGMEDVSLDSSGYHQSQGNEVDHEPSGSNYSQTQSSKINNSQESEDEESGNRLN
ncbi:hypothetical protein CLU79DRAFT_715793 [Phycomyces nitens]|nr:hypothetical protein CLU79DRAFT_715793 [Phycomyces nitens]